MKYYAANRATKKKFEFKKSHVLPILPLSRRFKTDEDQKDKTKFIQLDLKVRAGTGVSTSSYKKTMRVFELGSPQEWLDTLQDVKEVWRQNSVNGPQDRAGILAALLKGSTLTTFETALDEARTGPEDPDSNEPPEMAAMTTDHVEIAIQAISQTVFPHRALETQRNWMSRFMKKPREMTSRNTAAAIARLNNSLPLFPTGNMGSKYSEKELVGLLEWSLPEKWRKQLGMKGFDPSQHTREELIEELEILERHEPEQEVERTNNNKNNENKTSKFRKTENNKKKSGDRQEPDGYFCKECGRNRTHDTSNCFKIKNREKREAAGGNGKAYAKQAFSKRTFRKEVNALARKAGKNGAMDLYAAALKRAQDKTKKNAKKAKVESDPESSDSDESMHNLDAPVPKKLQDLICASSGKSYRNKYTKHQNKHSQEELHDKMAGDLWFSKSVKVLPFGEKFVKKVVTAESSDTESDNTDMELDVEEKAFLSAISKLEKKQAEKDKKKKSKKGKNSYASEESSESETSIN
jgi:hypothetical protein